jgi:hypothetical protein
VSICRHFILITVHGAAGAQTGFLLKTTLPPGGYNGCINLKPALGRLLSTNLVLKQKKTIKIK